MYDTPPAYRPGMCPFCDRIERGEYEITWRQDVVRFQPLNPVTPGHMLFLPAEHAEHPSPFLLAASMEAASRYAEPNEFYNLITSSGTAATQTVPHLHVHYVPRTEGDGLHLPWTGQQPADENGA
ncbi:MULTISPECIES: HIT family protein [Nocardia]|uniref:HIT family protein n=1 Tax=Nocardia TaxID=1817 RepID=UPI0024538AF4|nr:MULTISPECIES: HIT family protein [Nocardia]